MQSNGQIAQGSVQVRDRSIEGRRLLAVLRAIGADRNTREKASTPRSNENGAINSILSGIHVRDAFAYALLAQRALSAAGQLHAVPAIVRVDLRRAVAGLRRLQAVDAHPHTQEVRNGHE